MIEDFCINIDRLRKSGNLSLDAQVPPDFLFVEDSEIKFKEPVQVKGNIYVVDHKLVFHLDVSTLASVKCTICNSDTDIKIDVKDFYHIEEIAKLKSPIFNYSSILREEVLLEVPRFAECNDSCPEREFIKKYFKPD